MKLILEIPERPTGENGNLIYRIEGTADGKPIRFEQMLDRYFLATGVSPHHRAAYFDRIRCDMMAQITHYVFSPEAARRAGR